MSREVEFSWTYEGREVTARCDICPADPDTGVMGPYPETVTLIDEDGSEIPLTDDQQEALLVDQKFCQKIDDQYYGGWEE